jgi:hypothetical protein
LRMKRGSSSGPPDAKIKTGSAPIQRQIRLPGGRINSDRQKIHQGKMFVEPNNGTFVKIPVGSRKLPHLGGPRY